MVMKKYTLFIIACVSVVTACRQAPRTTEEAPIEADTTDVSSEPDSTIWGRLGESTGMSAFEFITDAGDTLEIYRTNPENGIDGNLMGQIRNTTDKFALTLQSDGESMATAINSTQLLRKWRCKDGSITIHSGGLITSDSLSLDGWKLWNGHLLLGQKLQTEYGEMHRMDTMDIVRLSTSELVIKNEYGELTRYTPDY